MILIKKGFISAGGYRCGRYEALLALAAHGSRNAYITTKWQALPPITNRWKIS